MTKDIDNGTCTSKRKILFVIESLGCGGAEKSLISLLSLLNRDKYELNIWMMHHEGAFLSLLPKDISVVAQPKYNFCEALLFNLSSVLYSVTLRFNKLFGRHEYWGETYYKSRGWAIKAPEGQWDVVFAYHQGLVTYVVADKFCGCKKVGWVNADIFKTGYNIKYNSKFYRNIDYICPVSDILHELLDAKMPEFSSKYCTVWDIINPIITRELASQNVECLRNNPDEYVLVTTGRLHVLKGYDMAVEAAYILKQKGVNYRWFFIGEGPERSNIERNIASYGLQDNVRLLGLKINPFPFMAQADVYVQTSRHEGFGMTIAEAKILQLPIVSTNFDVVYGQIIHGKNGLIAEMDAGKIAEQILLLLQDRNLREQIKISLRNEKNSTIYTEVKKVESIIDELSD